MKHGVASVGHGLTWGQKDDTFVIGSPNFNLGDPTNPIKTKSNKYKDNRFGGFGNILRYGKVPEAIKITGNKPVFNNPTKGRGSDSAFRQKLKKEIKDKEQGTPALYLGWAVITGNITKFLIIIIFIRILFKISLSMMYMYIF